MREILFKAKCAEEPYDWVEGYLNKCEREFIISNDDGLGVFIKPDTICQYTGLTDKNGNKIWENDIVGVYSEYDKKWCFSKVIYGHFNCSCYDGVYGWAFDGGDIRYFETYEVKGNIFDNPELLKEE